MSRPLRPSAAARPFSRGRLARGCRRMPLPLSCTHAGTAERCRHRLLLRSCAGAAVAHLLAGNGIFTAVASSAYTVEGERERETRRTSCSQMRLPGDAAADDRQMAPTLSSAISASAGPGDDRAPASGWLEQEQRFRHPPQQAQEQRLPVHRP
jgi:hypothetical protein